MTPLSFGFGMISAQHDPADQRSDADLYEDVLDLCAFAERLGFDAVWVTEHHFVDDGYMPSLLPVCAAVAARTHRIRIGTGVLLAPLHHPLRIAEDAATVDLLSRGRLTLGLGAGYRAEEFAGLGVDQSRASAALESTIGILRAAWSGGPVATSGSASVRVTPRPYTPAGPPIWLGARKRPGIRRAARLSDGFLAARVSPEEFGAQVGVLAEEVERAGRDPSQLTVGVHCPVFAWPWGDAWAQVVDRLHYLEWKYGDMVAEPYGTRAQARIRPSLSREAEQTLRDGAIVGLPAEVAETIAAYAAQAGPFSFHFVARLYWPGLDPGLQREAMAVFASEVMGTVRAAVARR